ncbi:hypothetical protein [Flavobacterium poyangense]|uniref:hypothetical protein n=1 Tax=Flavobacterium poyangense TaxID=2204302 RepID=UPI00141EC645|nr:hypothetical protein [Flavobacterium sp. JXAS1]
MTLLKIKGKSIVNVAGFVLLASLQLNAQIVKNTVDSPTTLIKSTVQETQSANKGLLSVRMSTKQRNAIVSPATGLVVYNTTKEKPEVFTGTVWYSIAPELTAAETTVRTISDQAVQQSDLKALDKKKNLSGREFKEISGNTLATVTLPADKDVAVAVRPSYTYEHDSFVVFLPFAEPKVGRTYTFNVTPTNDCVIYMSDNSSTTFLNDKELVKGRGNAISFKAGDSFSLVHVGGRRWYIL